MDHGKKMERKVEKTVSDLIIGILPSAPVWGVTLNHPRRHAVPYT